MRKLAAVVVLGAFGLAPVANAAIVWSETVNGEISANYLAPTSIALPSLTNSIIGSSMSVDRDYVTFTVPTGFVLAAITLAAFNSSDDLGFMAISNGNTFSVSPGAAPSNLGSILGYTHFGPGPGGVTVGNDALTKMGIGSGAIGFVPPLNAGLYTLWIQQTNAPAVGYQFDITIAAVPEPETWAMLGLGLAGLMAAVRRRRG